MSTKELAMETLQALPDSVGWQEIEERIRFMAAIEKAREEVRQGRLVAHEQVRELLPTGTTR